MNPFESFKGALKKVFSRGKHRGGPTPNVIDALDAAADWDTLEEQLVAQRAISRKRQRDAVQRLAPLAARVEALVSQARASKVRVVRENMLRQAQGYMQELEAEDEPAGVHAANCAMLTRVLKQVRRAKAMAERGITAEAIEAVSSQLEEALVEQEAVLEAASDLERAGHEDVPGEAEPPDIERRLAAVLAPEEPEEESSASVAEMEARLYE